MYNTDKRWPYIVDQQRRDIDIIRDIDLTTVGNWNVYAFRMYTIWTSIVKYNKLQPLRVFSNETKRLKIL